MKASGAIVGVLCRAEGAPGVTGAPSQTIPCVGRRQGQRRPRHAMHIAMMLVVTFTMGTSPAFARDDVGLVDLSAWQPPQSTATVDSVDALGDLFLQLFAQVVGKPYAISPPFQPDVSNYTVRLAGDQDGIVVTARAGEEALEVGVTATGPDGAVLEADTTIHGVDIVLDGNEVSADELRTYRNLAIGTTVIEVSVVDPVSSATRLYLMSVVREPGDVSYDLSGLYDIVLGKNPDGSSYGGTVSIEEQNEEGTSYCLVWKIGNGQQSEYGCGNIDDQGRILVVDWGSDYPVVYEILSKGTFLRGSWHDGAGKENLRRRVEPELD